LARELHADLTALNDMDYAEAMYYQSKWEASLKEAKRNSK
jgi:hypothetical protein